MNDYFKQLKDMSKDANKHRQNVTRELKKELKQELQELEEKIAKIKVEYESKILESEEVDNKNIAKEENLKKTISAYSIFNSKDLGNIVAELISTYTKREFVYQEKTIGDCDDYGIIVENSAKQAEYNGDYGHDQFAYPYGMDLYFLMMQHKAFVFSNLITRYGDRKIRIYTPSLECYLAIYEFQEYYDNMSMEKAYCKLFSFVKKFLDYVINYRIENNLQEIDINQLTTLKNDFIRSHQVEINKWCDKEAKVIEEQQKISEGLSKFRLTTPNKRILAPNKILFPKKRY